ncbi:MarR family transcriptional regulator [Vibrio olivae]
MQRIESHFELTFSEMDIYLISLVQFNAMSVSESARYMNISRQAAHKHVKNLESLNLVELTTSASNRREKSSHLHNRVNSLVNKSVILRTNSKWSSKRN